MMYTSALRLAPNNFDLYLSRSLAHTMSDPQYLDLALRDADEAIRLKPEDSQGWSRKGEVFIQMGDYESAIEMLTNSVGFAKPHERVAAQKALAAARSRSVAQTQISLDSSPNQESRTPSNAQGELQTKKATSTTSHLSTEQSNSSFSVPQPLTTPAAPTGLSPLSSTQTPFNASNNAFSNIPQGRGASTSPGK